MSTLHHNTKDITGQRFGSLVVSYIHPARPKNRQLIWVCKCDCGNEHNVRSSNLIWGKVKSCGCLKGKNRINTMGTHGMRNTRIYKIWAGIKTRCYNKKDQNYKNYGGRGIRVSKRWINSFENFYEDMKAEYQDNLSIDRIDNNRGYSKENCRWVTKLKQANNKRSNRFFNINGVEKTMAQWSRHFNIRYGMVMDRVYSGWTELEALTTPKNKRINI